jgi:hypothetical protein
MDDYNKTASIIKKWNISDEYLYDIHKYLNNDRILSSGVRFGCGTYIVIIDGIIEEVVLPPKNIKSQKSDDSSDEQELKDEKELGIIYYIVEISIDGCGMMIGDKHIDSAEELASTNDLDEAIRYIEEYADAVEQLNHHDRKVERNCTLNENSLGIYSYNADKTELVTEYNFSCEHYYNDSDSDS